MPILQTLQLLATLDELGQPALLRIRQRLEQGETLQAAWSAEAFFPPLVGQVLAAGEESGKTVDLLDQVCNLLELQLDESLNAASAALQPLVLLLLGLLVGFVLVATLLPLLQATAAMA